ncbi:hypothetical protein [Spiroplasma endosymbiont of Colias croceus]|uniref:hypothetical protein n=1 Tax=Spiroplasma endosymbiont of Colias croceus TaxID=3066310 RepID=UPI0030CBEB1E
MTFKKFNYGICLYKECKEKNISDDLINYGMLKLLEHIIKEKKDIDYALKIIEGWYAFLEAKCDEYA